MPTSSGSGGGAKRSLSKSQKSRNYFPLLSLCGPLERVSERSEEKPLWFNILDFFKTNSENYFTLAYNSRLKGRSRSVVGRRRVSPDPCRPGNNLILLLQVQNLQV